MDRLFSGMDDHGWSKHQEQGNREGETSNAHYGTVATVQQLHEKTHRIYRNPPQQEQRNSDATIPWYDESRTHTRKRELVDTLFQLGLSVSYDRVMDISIDMATATASQYQSDGVVCPFILRNGLFTTPAVDNIDHNPSSNTAQDAFHGTGISLFQNREEESDGVQRERAILPCL